MVDWLHIFILACSLGNVGWRKAREGGMEAEMTPKSQIDPLAARARAAVGDHPRPVEVEDGYRCHQQQLLFSCLSLSPLICFGLHLSFRLEIYSLGQCRAVLTEDNPLYTSPLFSAPPTFIPVCRSDGRPADFIAM